MDPRSAERGRQKKIQQDLRNAYSDEEAVPPEWVDILSEVNEALPKLEAQVAAAAEAFAAEPDIRVALEERERTASAVNERVAELNAKIRRLNLIAPVHRVQRGTIDADELLRPLYTVERAPRAD